MTACVSWRNSGQVTSAKLIIIRKELCYRQCYMSKRYYYFFTEIGSTPDVAVKPSLSRYYALLKKVRFWVFICYPNQSEWKVVSK